MVRAPLCTATLLALFAGGCNSLPDPGDPADPAGPAAPLRITTPAVQLLATADAQQVSLRALTAQDHDVTAAAAWSLSDPSIGTIEHGALTVRGGLPGGVYQVTARLQDQTATAQLLLSGTTEFVDASAPTDAKSYFGGSSGGAAPALVYPLGGSLLPPNLLQMRLQWRRDLGQQVFRIRVRSVAYRADLYAGASLCAADKCTFPVPDATWQKVARALAGQSATITVTGVASKGAALGTATAVPLQFAPEDIAGGVYYFSPSTRGIKRAPIGAKRAVDFVVNGAETGCAGCHAVSRDGKQVAIEFGSGATSVGSTVVSGSRAAVRNFALQPAIAWNFAWFNPTGDRLIANWRGQLSVRAAADGRVLSTVAAAQYGTGYVGGAMPEWSPDGKWIAFVRLRSATTYDFELHNEGDIVIMPYNDGAFGPAVPLVAAQPSTEVHFWPTWSPDSKWLIFNSQQCDGAACIQYNAEKTRLRLVRAVKDDGTAAAASTPIELVQGTHDKSKSNNWPKFAPFYQAGRYGFVIYSATY
ncbi:MAG TPA: hypothetical protein PLW65_28690, partial [Pseudomonadota bacterium]|nr:hypothetical protein [Pseudomonadota bacterium]